MRKPRDFDAELKALDERAAWLKDRKLKQLVELVIACGADSLSIEMLAGVLLGANEEKDAFKREGWRKAGTAFFQQARRTAASAALGSAAGETRDGSAAPAAAPDRAR
jgi:hypothetical protein